MIHVLGSLPEARNRFISPGISLIRETLNGYRERARCGRGHRLDALEPPFPYSAGREGWYAQRPRKGLSSEQRWRADEAGRALRALMRWRKETQHPCDHSATNPPSGVRSPAR